MIVYIGAGSGEFRDFVEKLGHGQMVSRQKKAFRIPKKGRWAFDNGAWTDFKNNVPFNDVEFLKRVHRLETLPEDRLPDWCICPDALEKRQSILYSVEWKELLSRIAPRLKWYLALQDYMHPEDVEYAMDLVEFDGLFIGGSDPWRSATAAGFVKLGHDMGVPVHIGRVNGKNRLQWAVDLGADSVDGTGWVWGWYGGPKRRKDWLEVLVNTPKPSRVLLPDDQEIQKDWLKFGEYLGAIFPTEEDWEARLPEDLAEDAHRDRYLRIMDMDIEDFVYWYVTAYFGADYATPERVASIIEEGKGWESEPGGVDEWKQIILDEAERFKGARPVPPRIFK